MKWERVDPAVMDAEEKPVAGLVITVTVLHDDDCRIWTCGTCSYDPDLRLDYRQ